MSCLKRTCGIASPAPYEPRYDAEGREVVTVGGRDTPVTGALGHPTSFDGLTPAQKRKASEVYRLIASELPVEGRDYAVSFSFPDPDGNPRLRITPRSELGMAFYRHLAKALKGRMSGKGESPEPVAPPPSKPAAPTVETKVVNMDVPPGFLPKELEERARKGPVPLEVKASVVTGVVSGGRLMEDADGDEDGDGN